MIKVISMLIVGAVTITTLVISLVGLIDLVFLGVFLSTRHHRENPLRLFSVSMVVVLSFFLAAVNWWRH